MTSKERLRAALERALRDMAPGRRLRIRLAAKRLATWGGQRPARVLDAGCETGLLSLALARRHPSWTLEGVDIDERMLAVGREWAREAGADVTLRYGDLTEGLPEGRYDAVAALECLAEIPDGPAALRAMAGSLAPGGLLVLHVPRADWRPVLPGSPGRWAREVRHGYGPGELEAELAALGLEVTYRRDTMRAAVQAAHELRDRVKERSLTVRAIVLPLLSLAVALELRGAAVGAPRGLYLEARRPA